MNHLPASSPEPARNPQILPSGQPLQPIESNAPSLKENKDYLLLLCAKVISRFGDSVDAIAYSWIVYMLTGSKLLMGTLFAVNSLPSILLSLFTGVLIDRWPKKLIVICADYGRGLLVFATGLLYLTGHLEVWHLFLFTLLISTCETFASPAENAWIPQILPKSLLLRGNSLSGSAAQTAELIGLAAAGGVVALIGSAGALWVDAATFFLSALLLGFVHSSRKGKQPISSQALSGQIPEEEDNAAPGNHSIKKPPKEQPSGFRLYFQELMEGMRYVKGNLLIFTTILLGALINFCLAPINVLQTVYVKEVLHAGAGALSLLSICISLGMIFSGLAVAKWGSKLRKSTMILSAFLLLGASFAMLGLPAPLAESLGTGFATGLAALFMLLIGASVTLSSAPLRSYVMEVTPGRMMGRISALTSMLSLSAVPLGGTLTGLVADFIPVGLLYAFSGSLILLITLPLLRFKAFRRI